MTTSQLTQHQLIKHGLRQGFRVRISIGEPEYRTSAVDDEVYMVEHATVEFTIDHGGNGMADKALTAYFWRTTGPRRPGLWRFSSLYDFSLLRPGKGRPEFKKMKRARLMLSVQGVGSGEACSLLDETGREWDELEVRDLLLGRRS